MPVYVLKFKANLENIKELTPIESNLWKFDIQSPGGDDVRKGITVSVEDVLPLEGSRGEANFIIKWPYANDQAYMRIIDHKTVKKAYTEDKSGEFVSILAFECRGLEPVAWHPSLDFKAESTGGTMFEQVDLSDRDWAEFDEENDLSVSITDVDYKIELAPNK